MTLYVCPHCDELTEFFDEPRLHHCDCGAELEAIEGNRQDDPARAPSVQWQRLFGAGEEP
jgi:hypothetical protein